MAVAGLYRRNLPSPPAIEFASPKGKQLFREALAGGTAEGFFKLISYYQTQSEPAYCGLATLAMVLNALAIDPGRTWKGPWRWFDDSMLDCCEPLEKIKSQGINFSKVACLAVCNGADVEPFRTNQSSLEDFRKKVVSCTSSEDCHLIVSYNRAVFNQTGTGHFSPIGCYHNGEDMVLILDVARFKYPPHWVPLSLLWDAMSTIDKSTGQNRGFMVISRLQRAASVLFTMSCRQEGWNVVAKYLTEDISLLLSSENVKNVDDILGIVIKSAPPSLKDFIKWVAEVRRQDDGTVLSEEEKERLALKEEVLKQIRETELFKHVTRYLAFERSFCDNVTNLGYKYKLADIAANVCCQGAELLTGKIRSSNGFCCRETNVKLLKADNKEEHVTTVSGTVITDGTEQRVDLLIPSSRTGPSCSCDFDQNNCCGMHPSIGDGLTALLFSLPEDTWLSLREEQLQGEMKGLTSIDGLPTLLQGEKSERMAMEARAILPIDCWQSIFSHLPDDALKTVSLVCKDFLELSNTFKKVLSVVHPSIRVLSKQLSRFKFLNKIYLNQFRGDIDEALLEIASSLINLEILYIYYQAGFKAESLKALGLNSKMKNLKALHCDRMQCLGGNDLVAVANSFPNLEELDLGFYDYEIEPLASKLLYLKKFIICGRYPISDRSMVALSTNCTLLKSVTIWCRPEYTLDAPKMQVTEYGIGLLLRNCSNLECLTIGFLKYSEPRDINIENSIRYAKALTSLEFMVIDVSDMLLSEIAKAKLPLKTFRLKYCENWTVMGLLDVLSSSNYLTKLSILEYSIGDVGIRTLLNGSNLVKLTHLDISRSQVRLSTLLLLLANCPSLIEIKMGCTKMSEGEGDLGLEYRNHCIQNLYIRWWEAGDEWLKVFGLMFPNLKLLSLGDAGYATSTGIRVILKNCMFIERLTLEGYQHGKLIETNNSSTNYSEVSAVNLKYLALSNSEIDDEGLAGLAKLCPSLVSLNLNNCEKTTAEGIKHQRM